MSPQNSELCYTIIDILGGCPVLADLHADTLKTKVTTLNTIIMMKVIIILMMMITNHKSVSKT